MLKYFVTLLCLILTPVLRAQVENGCIFLNFESFPNMALVEGAFISNQFESSFGLTFELENGSFPVLSQVGEPVTAFVSAWGADTPAPGVDIGQYFLTDDGMLFDLNTSPIILNFKFPIDSFAGCILDMDFGEEFIIEARDEYDQVILSEVIRAGDENTGDGLLTCWGFNLPGCQGTIYSIRYSGSREQEGGFGLGLENFSFCYSGLNIDYNIRDYSCNTFGRIELISLTNEIYEYSFEGGNFSLNNVWDNLLPGIYTIDVIDSDGCETSVDIEIENIIPLISSASVTHTSCNENNGEINLVVSPDNNAVFNIEGFENLSQDIGQFSNLSSGQYAFQIVDENGCLLDTSIFINPSLEPPEISLNDVVPDYCYDNSGVLEVMANGGTGELLYAIAGLPFQDNNIFENLATGEYLIIVQDEEGCRDSLLTVIEGGVKINSSIQVISPPSCNEIDGFIEINVNGGNGELFFYLDSTTMSLDPIFENLNSGIYDVTILDSQGCAVNVEVEIPCNSDCKIFFPNVITPNSDGRNDRFQIFSHPNYDVEVGLYNIYDRWGNLIFTKRNFSLHTSEKEKWWNGEYNDSNGILGVYTYLVILVNLCGEEELYAGDLTVLR